MALVTFINDSEPYLNAENLNNNFEYLEGRTFESVTLWTNNNPNNDFSAQNINLNNINYNWYEIIYISNKTGTTAGNTGKIPKGKGVRFNIPSSASGTGVYEYYRTCNYVNDFELSFTDAIQSYGTTSETNNSQMIPIQIIGYK